MPDNEFDIFVSYRSHDANRVRALVDVLIASGVRVWFAEYKILLTNYDQFQEAINYGIDHSQYALLFTREEWADSRYCQVEVTRIMQRMPPQNILNLRSVNAPEEHSRILQKWNIEQILKQNGASSREELIKKRHEWMEIDPDKNIHIDKKNDMFNVNIPCHEWPKGAVDFKEHLVPTLNWNGNVSDAVIFISEHTSGLCHSVSDSSLFLNIVEGERWTQDRFGVSLIPGDCFKPISISSSQLFSSANNAGFFRGELDGYKVLMSVDVGLGKSVVSSIYFDSKEEDDRAIYDRFRAYAKPWCVQNECTEYGLHLFHRESDLGEKNEHGHLAITTFQASDDLTSEPMEIWERRYAITMRDEKGNFDGEVDVTIGIQLPLDSPDRSLQTFCKYSPYFETIANTLQYKPPERWSEAGIVTLIAHLILIMGVIYGWNYLVSQPVHIAIYATMATLTGVLATNAVCLLTITSLSRRWQALGNYTQRLNRKMGAYERIAGELYDSLYGSLIFAVGVFCLGVVDWIGVLPLALGLYIHTTSPYYWLGTGVVTTFIGLKNWMRRATSKQVSEII